VLLVDNDDSYTYNLFHLIGELTGRPPRVVGHDEPVRTADYSHLVISPGPGHPGDPRRAGRAAELIMTADRPVLGVCLGHQLLGLAFGAAVIEVEPHHGLISRVRHDGTGVFRGLPQAFRAVRYHSLAVVDPPAGLEVTARACDDGVIMGLRHRDRELHGVQFHPESIAAESGRELMINFLGPPVRRPVRRSREPRSARPRRAAVLLRELPWRDPEDVFVAHYAARPRVCWLDSSRPGPDARFSYLGEPTDVIGGRYGGGPDTRPDLLDRLAELLARPAPADPAATSDVPFAFRGGYVGYLGHPEPDSGGTAELGRLDRFLAFDHDLRRCWAVAVPGSGQDWLDRAEAMITSTPRAAAPARTGRMGPITDPGPAWYRSAYDRVQRHLHSGDSYEVNLTFRRRVGWTGDHAELYRHLRRANPAPYAAFLRLPGATVLGSSPERFLRVDDRGHVQAKPIKGTAARLADPAADAAAAHRLATGTKTRAENLMIADLLRNDLGLTCRLGSVRVPALMRVESHPAVHQLVSTIEGDLADGADAVDCVRAALPPGSMTGAPKLRTREIIAEVEDTSRGLYSGVLGYFSYSGAADLSVVIRTIEARPEEVIIGVGGGVITLSDPDDEYAEALLKSEALLSAVRAGSVVPSR